MRWSRLFSWLPFVGRRRPVVSVLRLAGPIGAVGPLRRGLTLAGLATDLERAFSAPRLTCVALAINSPGGSPVQASLIFKRIRALAEEKDVPVMAFAEDVAASAGYWLALAADEIFADESSLVGSIGVVTAGLGFPELLKRWGVERRVYTSGRNKVRLDPLQDEHAEDVAWLKTLQAEMHTRFKALVRERRGSRLKADDSALFEGDVWLSPRALEMGIIDGVGDVRSVMRRRYGDTVRLKLIDGSRRGLIRRLHLTRPPPPDEWALALLGAVEERALWARFGL
jgi:serine protease SohB